MDELKDVIALLKQTDFDPTDIDTDLHKRVADAIQDSFQIGEQHSAESRSAELGWLCLDNIRVCGMGV